VKKSEATEGGRMDFLKNQAAKIREQLAGLTPSQRMLAGSLAVIMVMTLMWWTRYAGTSEMEDLYAQDLSAEDLARISSELESHGIAKKVVGNRIQVAPERKLEAQGMLSFNQAGPHDTSSGFDEIYNKMNSPWNPSDTQAVMFNRAKEATLAQIMREWPGVRDARVVINNAQRRVFGEASVMPSATVSLKLKGSGEKPTTKRLIEASADTVAGAVSGMLRSKVNVIIDGASHSVQDRDADGNGGGDTWMELVKEHERYFSTKIQDHLRWLDGVYVTVSVDPKMQQILIEKESYDKKGTLSIPQTTRERTDENSTNSHPPSEPGAVPNTGVANQGVSVANGAAPAGGGGEGTVSNTSETETKNTILPSWVHETIKSPAGASAVVGASVSIPRSYFVRIFKTATGSTKDPDEPTLTPFINAEMNRIKPMVLACVSKTPEDKVSVEWYWDGLPSTDVSAQPAAATSLPLALTGHMKEIGIGALAVISLFMVSMMVRKGSPAPIIPPQSERPVVASKVGDDDVVGEAGGGTHSMEGMELDDDSVKTEQMVSQVSTMVKENPDGAASLVKRWLNRA
jgi:flagellar biosynthesis/type III secretory pathway M-ring protein FliF/YscJ